MKSGGKFIAVVVEIHKGTSKQVMYNEYLGKEIYVGPMKAQPNLRYCFQRRGLNCSIQKAATRNESSTFRAADHQGRLL